MSLKMRVPLESSESARFASWLRYKGLLFMHSPNEGKRSPVTGYKFKAAGMSKGFPDLLIFNAPGDSKGVAVEMKRRAGGSTSKEQAEWLFRLGTLGWICKVTKGADDAQAWIEEIFDGQMPKDRAYVL